MNKKIIIAVSVLIAVLFVSAIAGTAFFYKAIVNSDNSKIASLNTEIANLTNQLSNLESQMPANLVTNLTETAGWRNTTGGVAGFPQLNLYGTVTNIGEGVAHNAGLHVVAYGEFPETNGTVVSNVLSINMTVPLTQGDFMGFGSEYLGNGTSSLISYSLTDLDGGQSAQINLNVFGSCYISNWTVTPVWTNTP